jgi:glutamate 5-kinase
MTTIKKLQADLIQLLTDVNIYDEKPTKTKSAAIRKQLGELKKEVTGIRAELVKLDHKGY